MAPPCGGRISENPHVFQPMLPNVGLARRALRLPSEVISAVHHVALITLRHVSGNIA